MNFNPGLLFQPVLLLILGEHSTPDFYSDPSYYLAGKSNPQNH